MRHLPSPSFVMSASFTNQTLAEVRCPFQITIITFIEPYSFQTTVASPNFPRARSESIARPFRNGNFTDRLQTFKDNFQFFPGNVVGQVNGRGLNKVTLASRRTKPYQDKVPNPPLLPSAACELGSINTTNQIN